MRYGARGEGAQETEAEFGESAHRFLPLILLIASPLVLTFALTRYQITLLPKSLDHKLSS